MAAGLFYAFSAVAVGFSLAVVFLRSPVTAVLSLVVSFFAVSGIFVLLGAPFLGVIQILVYAGAILVLFLYVTMLLSLEASRRAEKLDRWRRIAAFALVPGLVVALLWAVPLPEGGVLELPEGFGSVRSVGQLLLGPGVLLFELVSVVLIAGIVGAVLLGLFGKEKA